MPDRLDRIARLLKLQPMTAGDLGTSEAMCQVEMLLRRVADIDSSLLLTGESGVGKEVAAKFVHQISTRAGEPFVAVNCGAIPNDLIESQLFGHEKGAFTSAQARHHGYVERARNGILFLDEVGELPMLMQVKLLRLVQERTFTRIGGETAIKSGARIICATNPDLETAVTEGRFRRDLYYRINVIPVIIRHFAIDPTTSCRSRNASCTSFQRRLNASSTASHRRAGSAQPFLARQCARNAQPCRTGGGAFTDAAAECRRAVSVRDNRGGWGPAGNAGGGPRSGRVSAHPRRARRCRQPHRGGCETSWRFTLDVVRQDAQARDPLGI